jgi:hypothetical protein
MSSTTTTSTLDFRVLYNMTMAHIHAVGKKIYCAKVISDNRTSFYKVYKGDKTYASFVLHVGYTEDELQEFLGDLIFYGSMDIWTIGTIWWEDMTYSELKDGVHIRQWVHYVTPEIPTHLWKDTDKEERKEWRMKK